MTFAVTQVPRLAPGCRVRSMNADEAVLLIPEGLLQLDGAAAEILALVDGQRTIEQIIGDLQRQYDPAASEQIAVEVQTFLERLHGRSVLTFSSEP
jgi:pyrroloquinoline quinone biosynthesis protein D